MDFKTFHIGNLIKELVKEKEIELNRICNFMNFTEDQVNKTYNGKSIDSELLLRWCKLLEYDFFRLYSQHLILYSPVKNNNESSKKQKSISPQFRKNLYTKEVIDYVLSKINRGEMTKSEIIERYQIPKTTLYKWINKYNNLTK
ncbi:transposase [Empedobacter brevis]|uniref:transposase n=1 Tax=Empedobacter brevis TaxID=247 RepID=UPI0028A0477B|nr:transposase [Empedobacter brevis]